MRKPPFLIIFFLLLAFFACQNKKETKQFFSQKLQKEKLDSVGTWLNNNNNYLGNHYHEMFFKHYQPQLQRQNIDSAAHLLNIAIDRAATNCVYDTILLNEASSFMSQYENKISAKRFMRINGKLGFINRVGSDSKQSLLHFNRALGKATDPNLNVEAGKIHLEMTGTYMDIGQLDNANQAALTALKIFEGAADTLYISRSYSALSVINLSMNNFNEALIYVDKHLEQAKLLKDTISYFNGYCNKLTILETIEHPKFIESIDTLLDLYKAWQPKNIRYKVEVQLLSATKLLRQNKLEETKLVLDSIAPIIDQTYQDDYHSVLAKYEMKKGQGTQNKALYRQKMEEKQQESNWYEALLYCEILRDDAELRKDFNTAFTYQKTGIALRDSFWNKELRIKTNDLDKKYQTEKKEAQIQQQADEANRKNIVIALLVLGLLAFVYFYSLLQKQKNIITQQNELNEHTIAILSHDIKEPLLGVKLMLKKLNKDDPFVAQASQSLEGQINSVNGILTNLLKMKKLSFAKKDNNTKANVKSVVQNVMQELSVAIQSKALTVNNEIKEDFTVPISPEKLQIIVNNLLSNAVKYSFQNQSIRIYQEGNGFAIQDFGVGLSPEQRTKLMREVTASQRGTNQERGNGLGLFLVGAMLQGEQLKVLFDSPEVGGTIAKVLS
jgi:signal transduction histidine kinase